MIFITVIYCELFISAGNNHIQNISTKVLRHRIFGGGKQFYAEAIFSVLYQLLHT